LSHASRLEHRGHSAVIFRSDRPVGRCSLLINGISSRVHIIDYMEQCHCTRAEAAVHFYDELIKYINGGRTGLPVGFGIPTLAFDRLYIDPEYRRQGHATTLLTYGRAAAINNHLSRLIIAYEPNNRPAECLYRKFGFEDYGGSDGEFQHMVMWLSGDDVYHGSGRRRVRRTAGIRRA